MTPKEPLFLIAFCSSVVALVLVLVRPTRRFGRWLGILSLGISAVLPMLLCGLSWVFGGTETEWEAWALKLSPMGLGALAIFLSSKLDRKRAKVSGHSTERDNAKIIS